MVELAAASLRASGGLRLRVLGSSMLPAIRPGDLIRVRRCHAQEAAAGEVVLFLRDGRLFAHRVVGRAGRALVTRGDAVEACDPPVLPHELLGKVVSTQRGGRSFAAGGRRTPLQRAAAAVFRRSPLAGRLFTRVNALVTRGVR